MREESGLVEIPLHFVEQMRMTNYKKTIVGKKLAKMRKRHSFDAIEQERKMLKYPYTIRFFTYDGNKTGIIRVQNSVI